MEPGPWRYINHLKIGMEIIERLKVAYRGHTSQAKVWAARELSRIKIKKSESVINFRARFNDLIRRVKAAGDYKVNVTGRVACKQMVPKDERTIDWGRKEGERRKDLTGANTAIYSNKGGLLPNHKANRVSSGQGRE